MIRLAFTHRCRSVHYHLRRDTGQPILVQCERQRGPEGNHSWRPDSWARRGWADVPATTEDGQR